jgi:hypothetical protein
LLARNDSASNSRGFQLVPTDAFQAPAVDRGFVRPGAQTNFQLAPRLLKGQDILAQNALDDHTYFGFRILHQKSSSGVKFERAAFYGFDLTQKMEQIAFCELFLFKLWVAVRRGLREAAD